MPGTEDDPRRGEAGVVRVPAAGGRAGRSGEQSLRTGCDRPRLTETPPVPARLPRPRGPEPPGGAGRPMAALIEDSARVLTRVTTRP